MEPKSLYNGVLPSKRAGQLARLEMDVSDLSAVERYTHGLLTLPRLLRNNSLLTKWSVPPVTPMVSIRGLIVNAIIGLIILFIANAVGMGVEISVITLLICAVFGVPGAILVILLAYFDIAFAAAIAPLIPI